MFFKKIKTLFAIIIIIISVFLKKKFMYSVYEYVEVEKEKNTLELFIYYREVSKHVHENDFYDKTLSYKIVIFSKLYSRPVIKLGKI